eukprot:TRINITY_DN1519_c0_g2_i1.p1 TRINITY_DN1519_c0_g2~~TRINITY_DN1519_c0_g2_i1.p1  ORF type:complete len:530 (-),score=86.10 TRINITY_DN1519_c0_g2_i1:44-1633(-)
MFDPQVYLDQLSTKGLYPSSWPSEHGDNQRSKMYPGGLTIDPSKPLQDQVNIVESPTGVTFDPQMIYTREKNQLYVFGGRIKGRYFNRLNAETMEIEQEYLLNDAPYPGGALMHENGYIYVINGNILRKFRDGDITESQLVKKVTLPDINGFFTCANGIVTLENVLLVIKLFAMNYMDYVRLLSRILIGRYYKRFFLVLGLCFLEYFLRSQSFLATLLVTLLVMAGAAMLLFDAIVPLEKARWRFRKFFQIQHGILILVEPENLKIVSQHILEDKCSFPRLSVSKRKDNKQHVTVLGDCNAQQFIYNYDDDSFTENKAWEKPYRLLHARSSRGTGPCTIGRNVFFTNNTYTEGAYCDNYTLWKANVDDASVYKKFEFTPVGKQGFMWWSVVSNPIINGALAWDTLNSRLICFDYDLNILWEPNRVNEKGEKVPLVLRPHDCIVMSPKGGHIYLTEVHKTFDSPASLFVDYFTREFAKDFVVLDARTGTEIARLSLSKKITPRACNICIGNNDDVIVGLGDRMVRISNKK